MLATVMHEMLVSVTVPQLDFHRASAEQAMTERLGPDQSAANEELTPAERLALMQTQHRTLDQKIIELSRDPGKTSSSCSD